MQSGPEAAFERIKPGVHIGPLPLGLRDGGHQRLLLLPQIGFALLRDLEHPEIWTERYHNSTWLDYVRH